MVAIGSVFQVVDERNEPLATGVHIIIVADYIMYGRPMKRTIGRYCLI